MVMTLASHARGPAFESRLVYTFEFFFLPFIISNTLQIRYYYFILVYFPLFYYCYYITPSRT